MDAKELYQRRLQAVLGESYLDNDMAGLEPASIDFDNTLSNVSLTAASTGFSGFGNPVYTVSSVSGNSFPWTYASSNGTTTAPWVTHNPTSASTKINLSGENADIEVNGWSLVAAVKRIEERLALFQPNPKLEAEWEDLRALGEQYRQLEQHIKDKQATFDRLKSMPAPDIEQG